MISYTDAERESLKSCNTIAVIILAVVFAVVVIIGSSVHSDSNYSQLINYDFRPTGEYSEKKKIPDDVSAAAAALSAPQWRRDASPRLRRIISLAECTHIHPYARTVIQFARYITIIMIAAKLNIFFFFFIFN